MCLLMAYGKTFEEKPEPLTGEGKRAWLKTLTGVALGSDAFSHLEII